MPLPLALTTISTFPFSFLVVTETVGSKLLLNSFFLSFTATTFFDTRKDVKRLLSKTERLVAGRW